MTKIAVIGAGRIGGTVGDAWRAAGHDVTFGVRDPAERGADGRSAASPEDAIKDADIVLFALPGAAVDPTVTGLGRTLHGKVIIDATNAVGAPTMQSPAILRLARDGTPVYRAFNSYGWENMRDPHYGDDVADMFYSGPEGPARPTVARLIADVGLRPMYVGTDPELVDNVLRLWFALTNGQKMGRGVAFKVLTR